MEKVLLLTILVFFISTIFLVFLLLKIMNLRKRLLVDPTTGVFNKRMLKTIEEEIRLAEKHKYPVVFMFIDIDNFKKFNDLYGHLFGDQVLLAVSNAIKKSVRESNPSEDNIIRKADIIIRYGGDEFLVILFKVTVENALAIAERIRSVINGYTFELDGKNLKITISIGISSFPADGSTIKDLVEKADRAMLESKRQGGNRIIVYYQEK